MTRAGVSKPAKTRLHQRVKNEKIEFCAFFALCAHFVHTPQNSVLGTVKVQFGIILGGTQCAQGGQRTPPRVFSATGF